MSLRVVLADDHPAVRHGLSALLGAVDGIEVVGVAANGEEAVRAAVELSPDVIVMASTCPAWTASRPPERSSAARRPSRS